MTGTPEGSTESSFMEKPGIEPATPGLQDKAVDFLLVPFVYWRKQNFNGICNFLPFEKCAEH